MWFSKSKTKDLIPLRTFVSVRMEAIGGQGANSAGKILAEAAVLGMNYTGNHFSSFGSEKRGSPVRSYVRFSTNKQPVRTASSIKNPDLLVIFHESLLESHQEVLSGTTEDSVLLINSRKSPKEFTFPVGTKIKKIHCIDATTLAMKSNCGLNAVMLGALARLCPEIETKVLRETLQRYFSHLPEKVSKNNLSGFDLAQNHLQSQVFKESQALQATQKSALPEMGWLNAPLGGMIINPGNSALKDHSASRKGIAPEFTKEICFNCGFCDMVCPDFCFVWKLDPSGEKNPELQGIDYQYCKGCQKCVTVCPVEALKPVLETEISAAAKKIKLFPEIQTQTIEDRWKQLDWVTYTENLSKEGQMMSPETELLDPKSYLKPDFPADLMQKSKKEPSK